MADTIIIPPDTTEGRIERLERVVATLSSMVTDLRNDLARSAAPIALEGPDGTVSIRDPDIIAQCQVTGIHAYAYATDPPPPPPLFFPPGATIPPE